ncbi:stromal cell-derived factor 1 isoform X2 [Pezoporus flaviventris]|uniref:stromal cell-derived factor 1 isoform X2 n=1 Tax=Pezoporus flaviventris TaxID=889875 RepID=UPI002AB2D644|nr:stromal cell-derived factor 1 isoform X2 [Pezoporus flaviventris]
MDLRSLALLAFALAVLSLSEEKPVSLTYRCPCRFYESNVARANIKHLKILSTPNCSLQIVARLKSNSKQVCIDPKLKWIQEYLEKALNKITAIALKALHLPDILLPFWTVDCPAEKGEEAGKRVIAYNK